MSQRPIADGLIEWEAGAPRLLGGRRKSDGKVVFPMPEGAEARYFEPLALAREGSLWSYTIQRFRPKSPPYMGEDDERTFKPFALGYVELPGQVIVETRIETDDFDNLKIGMPMRLDVAPFRRGADGADLLTYVFRPA